MQVWAQHLVRNSSRRLSATLAELEEMVPVIVEAAGDLASVLAEGRSVLVCGNGGSAAAAQHFAAEFTGKLSVDRRPFSGIALSVDTSAMTAIANDFSFDDVFARQVGAHAAHAGVLVGLSTSGTSVNVARAVQTAGSLGIRTIVLTGSRNEIGGDVQIRVASTQTARVQETHDLVLHQLAQISERLLCTDLRDDASADRFPFVLEPESLYAFRTWCTSSSQSLVTTNGAFDLLHEGHRDGLAASGREGDQLVVLVNSDESVRSTKGPSRPIQGLDARIDSLRRIPGVSHVVVLHDQDPRHLLEHLRPDVHCKGEEYLSRPMPEREVVERHGGRVVYTPLTPDRSTTSTIDHVMGRQ